MVKSECTDLLLGYDNDSVEIMKEIVSYFGGYLDEDDCDDEPYYYIKGRRENNKQNKRNIIYVIQEELNKKYGGYVVIKD